jgi:hypothetical protein
MFSGSKALRIYTGDHGLRFLHAWGVMVAVDNKDRGVGFGCHTGVGIASFPRFRVMTPLACYLTPYPSVC